MLTILTIKYLSGEVDVGGIFPPGIADGVNSPADFGERGSTGTPLPNAYMAPYPVNLGALVGAFTDINGQIIGAPFAVGDGPMQTIVPKGATQLQLGINDDFYADNSGNFIISVSTQAEHK